MRAAMGAAVGAADAGDKARLRIGAATPPADREDEEAVAPDMAGSAGFRRADRARRCGPDGARASARDRPPRARAPVPISCASRRASAPSAPGPTTGRAS